MAVILLEEHREKFHERRKHYIARNLRRARLCKGLPLQEVAKCLDMFYGEVRQFESGEQIPPQSTLVKLANLFCCTPEDFYRPPCNVDVSAQILQYPTNRDKGEL